LEEANGGEFVGLKLPRRGDDEGGGGVGAGDEESEGEGEGSAEKEKRFGNGEFGQKGHCEFRRWEVKEEVGGSVKMKGFGEVNCGGGFDG